MIDIGVNLLHDQLRDDRDAVVSRACRAGVEHMVITGTNLEVSEAAIDYVAAASPHCFSATAGIHPHEAKDAPGGWQRTLAGLARRPQVVAVGETGLDFNRNFSPADVQEQVFLDHLAIAADVGKPVFVHERDAGAAVARCLETAAPPVGVVVHCFTGSRQDMDRFLALGCHIGITGWVCDRRRGERLRGLVPHIPLERLMIESDAPFLRPHNAPRDEFGRRNEPALVTWVVRQLAALYGMAEADLAALTAANARRFFALSLPA